MDMTIQEEIEQLVLRCIAADGLKACPKDFTFLEKYKLKGLYFTFLRTVTEGRSGLFLEELDLRAKDAIKWDIFPTGFPLLRQKYGMEGKDALMARLYLEERYFRELVEQTGMEERP